MNCKPTNQTNEPNLSDDLARTVASCGFEHALDIAYVALDCAREDVDARKAALDSAINDRIALAMEQNLAGARRRLLDAECNVQALERERDATTWARRQDDVTAELVDALDDIDTDGDVLDVQRALLLELAARVRRFELDYASKRGRGFKTDRLEDMLGLLRAALHIATDRPDVVARIINPPAFPRDGARVGIPALRVVPSDVFGALRALEADPTDAARWDELGEELDDLDFDDEARPVIVLRLAKVRVRVGVVAINDPLFEAMLAGSMAEFAHGADECDGFPPIAEEMETHEGYHVVVWPDGSANTTSPWGDNDAWPNAPTALRGRAVATRKGVA